MKVFERFYVFCIYTLAIIGVLALLFISLLQTDVIGIETVCDTIDSVLQCTQYIVINQ